MADWKPENGRSPSAAAKRAHAVLRLYGYLDGLVPRKVVPMLDKLWPHSESYIFAKAAHAPFISHRTSFVTCWWR